MEIGPPSSVRSVSSCLAVMMYAPERDFETAMPKRHIARNTRGVDVPSILATADAEWVSISLW
jgi:hypothetical protein